MRKSAHLGGCPLGAMTHSTVFGGAESARGIAGQPLRGQLLPPREVVGATAPTLTSELETRGSRRVGASGGPRISGSASGGTSTDQWLSDGKERSVEALGTPRLRAGTAPPTPSSAYMNLNCVCPSSVLQLISFLQRKACSLSPPKKELRGAPHSMRHLWEGVTVALWAAPDISQMLSQSASFPMAAVGSCKFRGFKSSNKKDVCLRLGAQKPSRA